MRKKVQDTTSNALNDLLMERGISIRDDSKRLFVLFDECNDTRISVDDETITAINYHGGGRWEQLNIHQDGTCALNICLYGGF